MDSEIRSLKGELRAKAGFTLEGIAARYGVRSSNLGGFYEVIAPGAFKRSLADGAKVVICVNHDPNLVLGNTKAGTAKVYDSPEGLRFSVQLDPQNTVHTNTYASVKRGDLDSCSFAFKVANGGEAVSESKDSAGKPCQLRTLKDVDLIDCSVVAYPAYPTGTEVDARSLEARGLLRVAAPAASQKHVAAQLTPEQLAKAQGITLAEFNRRKEMNHRSVLLTKAAELGRAMREQTDADLRARAAAAAKVIAADDAQEKKDDSLRERMEAAAGRTYRKCRGK